MLWYTEGGLLGGFRAPFETPSDVSTYPAFWKWSLPECSAHFHVWSAWIQGQSQLQLGKLWIPISEELLFELFLNLCQHSKDGMLKLYHWMSWKMAWWSNPWSEMGDCCSAAPWSLQLLSTRGKLANHSNPFQLWNWGRTRGGGNFEWKCLQFFGNRRHEQAKLMTFCSTWSAWMGSGRKRDAQFWNM